MTTQTKGTSTPRTIVLLGKVGHGKTRILNKLCGTSLSSSMGAKSCTRELQYGISNRWGLNVVDTPGFYSSEEIDLHTEAQRKALEDVMVSGIYAVIKYSSSSEIAEVANRLMDFAGEDDIRIIVTHADTAEGPIASDLKTELHRLLEVAENKMTVVGKESDAKELEDFVYSTLHSPRNFRVPQAQIAAVAALSVGARQYNKEIEELPNSLLEAERALSYYGTIDCDETKLCRNILFHGSLHRVNSSRRAIKKNAKSLLPEEQEIVLDKMKEVVDAAVLTFRSENDPRKRKRRYASSVRGGQDPSDFRRDLYDFLLRYPSTTHQSAHKAQTTNRSSYDEDSSGPTSNRSRKSRSVDGGFDFGALKAALDDERLESRNLNGSAASRGMDPHPALPGHSESDTSLTYYNKACIGSKSYIFEETAKKPGTYYSCSFAASTTYSSENNETQGVKSQVTERFDRKNVAAPKSKRDANPSASLTDRSKKPGDDADKSIGTPRLTQRPESPHYENSKKETTCRGSYGSGSNPRMRHSDSLQANSAGCHTTSPGAAFRKAHSATSSSVANKIGGDKHQESYCPLSEAQKIQPRKFPTSTDRASRRSTADQSSSRSNGWPDTSW